MKSFTKQDKPIVVLDTNIVVSALIAREGAPAKIFEKLVLGKIENYTSKQIISEIKEVFNRKETTKRTFQKARNFIIKHYLNNSIQLTTKVKVNVVEHKSDNKFIETAIEAKAGYIITGDCHLLKLKEFNGIKIVKARQFLEERK